MILVQFAGRDGRYIGDVAACHIVAGNAHASGLGPSHLLAGVEIDAHAPDLIVAGFFIHMGHNAVSLHIRTVVAPGAVAPIHYIIIGILGGRADTEVGLDHIAGIAGGLRLNRNFRILLELVGRVLVNNVLEFHRCHRFHSII